VIPRIEAVSIRRSPAWIKSPNEDRLFEGAKDRKKVRGIREIRRRNR